MWETSRKFLLARVQEEKVCRHLAVTIGEGRVDRLSKARCVRGVLIRASLVI